eukprot:TRINITY_DN18946_c0_g1_i1.p1 TRINITY_DN18946_c0_g1~~TRINITY_DN18946_c0_g1_i1.p1  ORF type:complete len:278 (-),score=44.64 TRINITY_DN18946_c0_g1_i1:166-999(-)
MGCGSSKLAARAPAEAGVAVSVRELARSVPCEGEIGALDERIIIADHLHSEEVSDFCFAKEPTTNHSEDSAFGPWKAASGDLSTVSGSNEGEMPLSYMTQRTCSMTSKKDETAASYKPPREPAAVLLTARFIARAAIARRNSAMGEKNSRNAGKAFGPGARLQTIPVPVPAISTMLADSPWPCPECSLSDTVIVPKAKGPVADLQTTSVVVPPKRGPLTHATGDLKPRPLDEASPWFRPPQIADDFESGYMDVVIDEDGAGEVHGDKNEEVCCTAWW